MNVPLAGWSRSGTFAQIRSEGAKARHSPGWSRSGTFAQIRCRDARTFPRAAGVGREPSLRYASWPTWTQETPCWSRSGTFAQIRSVLPFLRWAFAGVGREPSLRYALPFLEGVRRPLESVGNLRSDTLGRREGASFSGLESVGNLRSDTLVSTALSRRAWLESVGNLRSDTLTERRSRWLACWSRSGTFAQIR